MTPEWGMRYYVSDAGSLVVLPPPPSLPDPRVPEPHHVADRHEHFVKLVIALLSIPNLFRNYWAPNAEASCTRHLTEAAKTDWFDFATFAAISRDIFDRPLITKELTEIRSIRIVAGRHDPYFEPDVDLSVWRALFPGALVDIVDAGHMIPFERPATEWLMV